MKKTGLLLLLVSAMAAAQQATPNAAGVIETNANMPVVRYVTPSASDLYCAGLISPQRLPDANYVNGTLDTPSTTKIVDGELVYLAGGGYQVGQLYAIMRELRDINEFEFYPGQSKLLAATGHPYGDIGRVRVLDVRSHSAIAEVVFACDPVNPGDIAVPFVEKQQIAFRAPVHFDRFLPSSDKINGRIVLGKDFDGLLATGGKVYMNLGSNQGIKVGDYLRVVRTYTASLHDPVDSLSFKATMSEDTQKRTPSFDAGYLNPNKGPNIHVADLPRHGVGEVVVIGVTPTTSTAMIVFALEDVHVGDGVEMDNPQ
jgi:hypothetical protein